VAADGVIIAGHARLAAARKLNMTEVPVIVLYHLTEAQRRALVLADNKLALNAGWDEEALRVELQSLQEDGFDLDVVGFTDEELENLLRDPGESNVGLTDEDAVPDEP
jgi:ParB-like chromosome segregation protein Spo0J